MVDGVVVAGVLACGPRRVRLSGVGVRREVRA